MSDGMFDDGPGRLEKSLDYLCWRWIAGAVLEVYRQNEREEKGGAPIKANADSWCLFELTRRDIWTRTREAWCRRTNLDQTWFPYSIDAVARLYFKYRKRNDGEIHGFEAEIRSV